MITLSANDEEVGKQDLSTTPKKNDIRKHPRLSWAEDETEDFTMKYPNMKHSTDDEVESSPSNKSTINTGIIRKLSISSLPSTNDVDHISDNILPHKNNRTIWCLRLTTMFALVIATVIVAVLTFVFSRRSEMEVFETHYYESVSKIKEIITIDMNTKVNVGRTVSAQFTSRFGQQNQWPNVTLPNFQKQLKHDVEIANAIAISFNPIITQATRVGWEAYAVETVDLLNSEQLTVRQCDTCRIVADGIFRDATFSEGQRNISHTVDDQGNSVESRHPTHFVPVWEIVPIETFWTEVMFNLHSEIHRQRALDDMLTYKVPTTTLILHTVLHNQVGPSSILFHPVFDDFHEPSAKVVGSIAIFFTWSKILEFILPGYIKDLYVVLEEKEKNTTNQINSCFTYIVSGQNVTLLGEGDLHEIEYDDYETLVHAHLTPKAEEDLNLEHLVTYDLRMYPSRNLQNQYLTWKPLVMTIVVVSVFILTSGVFILYDYLVYHRQNVTLQFAEQTGRIVNSMFPSTVQKRLFSSTEHKPGNDTKKEEYPHWTRRSSDRMKEFLKSGFYSKKSSDSKETDITKNTVPIADLFHHTTIMFADIVSFTEWSSKHSPGEVFYLLETIFFAFDKAANRKRVFKLGTIGDCYIAVAGVPDPREDHAVVMALFADECRRQAQHTFHELSIKLDPSVTELSMRFGLHSGSITAGVLRGEKSRFELFGDTINTASRMESTCKPGKIQISEETAGYLCRVGLDSWLQPRMDIVHVKGKGFVKTYWLEIGTSVKFESDNKHQQVNIATASEDRQMSFVHELYPPSDI